ncbi:autotransporter outer membrane beta-barrel domain-containing protein [Labrys sp. LIt4]|uniref:autotransporter outer membrane beta-barrel domain-containing protein n=1 Tax=Labrys sp. LIt4 TaxID=2821355 RepID=UPI001ADEDE0E|nr:autotransporter outer membrane beta-barrel domain-containing protein [Labrys sp. LIt4]MBP0582611.1 autotransporter outer membrane beta-barrel domain-containing protein [Labrys sp. LIt4]
MLTCIVRPASLRAQSWTGAVDNDWMNAANWTPATLPTSGDAVNIDTTTPNTVILGVSGAEAPVNVADLSVGSSGVGALTIQAASTLSLSDRGVIADEAGSQGTVTVAGDGSALTVQNELEVGNAGKAALIVQGGGSVEAGTVVVAGQAGSTGTITVDGEGSTLSVGSSFLIAGSGDGALTVENGGKVIAGDDLTIAGLDGSSGSLAVNGSGSSLSVEGGIAIGTGGKGSLTVTAGGQADAAEGVSIGGATGSGVLTVDGDGSNFHSDSFLIVGADGAGSLLVTNGGTVGADSEITIADHGAGEATVSKNGSTLTTADLSVGRHAVGTLSVNAGGTVRADDVTLGVGQDGSGSVAVAGKGSSISTGTLTIGLAGIGQLIVSEAGTARSGGGIIGGAAGGSGTVTVDGAGSSWTDSKAVTIGDAGSGILTVVNAGRVDTNAGILGNTATGSGTAHIAGEGSVWTNAGALTIGNAGTALLNIDTGGTLVSAAASIGSKAGGSGTAVIAGSGSSWIARGAVTIGDQGTGRLDVIDGSRMVATGGVLVASQVAGKGTLNLGSQGELQTLALTAGKGTAQVNFNVGVLKALANNDAFISGFSGTQLNIQAGNLTIDNAGFRIATSSPLTGSGALVSQGSGMLITNADNSYAGGTRVASGILAVGDAAHAGAALSGGGGIEVSAGAMLGGYGSVTGTLTNSGIVAVANAIDGFGNGRSGTFTVNGTLLNNGVAKVAGTGVGNVLSVASYVGGEGSTIVLNTYLGADNSASDLLTINGGTASGHSILAIHNAGGQGAATVGNGIRVVAAADGATTDPNAFSLASVVAAGAYDYNLFKGGVGSSVNDQDWYLRTVGLSASAQTAVAYPDILGNFAGATLAMLQQRNASRIPPRCPPGGNLGQGPEMAGRPDDCWAGRVAEPILQGAGAWGRIGGQAASYDPRQGSAYRQWLGFMQAGYEGTALETTAGFATVGLYASIGTSKATIDVTRDPVTGMARRGRISTTGYGVGADVTWHGNDGLYADLTGQFTWFESSLSDKVGGHGEGWATAAALEVGKRYSLAPDWTLVPWARLAYTDVHVDGFTDLSGAAVRFDRAESLHGLGGLRLEKLASWRDAGGQAHNLLIYGTAGLDYAILDGTRLDIGGTFLTQRNQRLWGDIGIGGYYAWGAAWVLYGEAGYSMALGPRSGSENHVLKATAGLRHTW